jgi:hypothetical protein
MTLSCLTILAILGAGEMAHGLLCLVAGMSLTPRDHIVSGLCMLGLAVAIGGVCGRPGRRRRDA